MTATSIRAQSVADILWELKKADKLATLSTIANRAGFSAGQDGRTVRSTIKIVRRDWPHLEWWRAVADNGQVDEEQNSFLMKAGFGTEVTEGSTAVIKSLASQLMTWKEPSEADAESSSV